MAQKNTYSAKNLADYAADLSELFPADLSEMFPADLSEMFPATNQAEKAAPTELALEKDFFDEIISFERNFDDVKPYRID